MTNATNRTNRSATIYALIAILFLQGISGIGGGVFLLIDPSGETIGFEPSTLEQIPFESYLIPGLILTILLGVVPAVMAVLIALLKSLVLMWWGSLALGIALIIWLVVEYYMIGFASLQMVYGVVALIILALTIPTRELMTR